MIYSNPTTKKIVAELYHDEQNQPIMLKPGQQEIFDIIAGRLYPRSWIGTYTQYGKSFTVGLGALTRVTHYPEKWTIIAPKTDQAKIIMGVMIDHIFDNELTAKKFEIEKGETQDRIRRERSKNKLTFRLADGGIGGVQILSAQGQKRKNIIDAVMGFGSPNIILDESSLLQDDHFAGIIRMLGGHKDNFLMQIGNPFYRNHFHKASKNPKYVKVRVDYRQGIREGRLTLEQIREFRDEMRPELFRVMYDVKFPAADAIDKDGYSPLVTEEDLERAERDDVQLVGKTRMGVDVAGGGRNKTVVTVKGINAAKIVFKTGEDDPAVIGPKIIHYVRKYKIKKMSLFIDKVGIGHGLWKWLVAQLGDIVVGVNAGHAAEEGDPALAGLEFGNLRAQMYWRMAEWINAGAKLKRHSGWAEFEDARYKVQSSKKIRMKTKEEMARDGIASPDHTDSLSFCFAMREVLQKEKAAQKPYVARTPYEGSDQRRAPTGKLSNNERGFGRYADVS